MSAATQSARSGAPRAGAKSRPPLAIVPDPRPRHGGPAFVALVVGLLAAGLAALLAMNTLLAQDAFVVQNLQQQQRVLTVTEDGLAARVAKEATPARLATRAKALGMQAGGTPLFLQLPSGRILGDTTAAQAR